MLVSFSPVKGAGLSLALFLFLGAVPLLAQETRPYTEERIPADRPASPVGQAGPAGGVEDTLRRVGLREALSLFEENNLGLQRARSEARSLQGEARQAEAYPNPTLQVTHEPIWRNGMRRSETYLNVTQQVEWGGRSARIEAARQTSDVGRAKTAADSARLAAQVATSYVEAATAETRRRRLERVTRVFRRADSSMADRETGGDASGYAVRRIRLERARYEQRLAAARLAVQSARQQLALLILPGGPSSVAAESLPTAVPPSLSEQEALRTALRRRPELRRWQSEVDARQAARRAARREPRPDPSVTAGYKRQSDGFRGLFLGVGIPLPFFDRNRGAAEAASARVQAARSQRTRARQQIRNEVRRAHAAYVSSRRQTELVGDDLLDGADDLLRIAQASYEEGEMSLVELLDAADAYRDARLSTIDLRADLWKRYFELMRATGRPLDLP